MQRHHPYRDPATSAGPRNVLLLSVVLGALSMQLAAQLPATGPATPPAIAQSTNSFAKPADTSAATPPSPHRSHITFANGLLTVSASNASLNGLIRDIARQTGMKVNGSVAEDRAFGEYGPADPQRILATLLDGTGSNIIILSSASDSPLELILTPRTGAATPPSATANVPDDDSDSEGQPPPGAPTPDSAFRERGRATAPSGNLPSPSPQSAPPQNGISPASETVVFPPADETSTPSTATTTPADTSAPTGSSTDSVKTPQQIFEQLQKLRQQNSAKPQ